MKARKQEEGDERKALGFSHKNINIHPKFHNNGEMKKEMFYKIRTYLKDGTFKVTKEMLFRCKKIVSSVENRD